MPLVSKTLARQVAEKFCRDKSDISTVTEKILFASQLWEELDHAQKGGISGWETAQDQVAVGKGGSLVNKTKKKKGLDPVYEDTKEHTNWYRKAGGVIEPIYIKREVPSKGGRPKATATPLTVLYSFLGASFLIAAQERPTRGSGGWGTFQGGKGVGRYNYKSEFEKFVHPIAKALGHKPNKQGMCVSKRKVQEHIQAVQKLYDEDDS